MLGHEHNGLGPGFLQDAQLAEELDSDYDNLGLGIEQEVELGCVYNDFGLGIEQEAELAKELVGLESSVEVET